MNIKQTILNLLSVIKIVMVKAKLSRWLFVLIFQFSFQNSEATFSTLSFWKNRAGPNLKFTTSAQTILSGLCSGIVTVGTYNASNVLTNVGSNLTVSLAGGGSTAFYSDSNCTSAISSITVASGTSTSSFYFVDNSTGSVSVTVSATNYTSGTQSETISTNNYVWTGGGGNTSWATGGNWSGGSAPGSSNIAVFNSTCSSNCSPSIAANISIGGLRMNSGYSGTITQNAGVTVTVGTSNWIQLAGSFAGGNSSITVNGVFNLAGGSFTSTSGTFKLVSHYTTSGSATFTHNSGTLSFGDASTVTSQNISVSSETYNHVTFAGHAGTMTLTGTMNVAGNLTLNDNYSGSMNGGTISVSGNVTSSGAGYGGTTLVKLVGSANQTITGSSGAYFPKLEIASTGGTVSLSGTLQLMSNYTVTSGTLSSGTSTIIFGYGANSSTHSITVGSESYNNVTFNTKGSTVTISGSTFKISGTLTLNDSYGGNFSSGTLLASGNVTVSGVGLGGAGLLKIAGSANQTVTGSSGALFPKFEIASTGGTVTYSGTLQLANNYTFTSGTLDASTSTLLFNNGNNASTQSISVGSETYNNVSFNGYASTYPITGTMKVNGNLTLADRYGGGNINTGTIQVSGNISATNNGYKGTVSIQMIGGTGATLSQSASSAFIPTGFSINKSAGIVVTLASAVSLTQSGQSLSVTSGNIDMAGYAFTIASSLSLNGNTLTKNSGVLTVNGSVAGTGSLFGGTVN